MVAFREFESTRDLEGAAATLLTDAFQSEGPEPFAVMLTGGKTPLALYARLQRQPPRAARNLHVLLSDERHVPPDDPALNYGHIAPLVAAMDLPDAQVLRVDTRRSLEDAARQYDADVERFLRRGRITLGILGLGGDGHLASLFTDEDVRQAQGSRALAVRRPEPPARISLTPAVLARAQRLVFLVSGPEKAAIIAQWRRNPESVLVLCARRWRRIRMSGCGSRMGMIGVTLAAWAVMAYAKSDVPADAPVMPTNPVSAVMGLAAPPADHPQPRTRGFVVGEEVFYDIYWGMIPVGRTHITTGWIKEKGRTLLAIRYRTRSYGVIARIYPVNDRIEAIIEPTTFLPVRFEKDLKEGRRKVHEVTTFDHQKLKAHWTSLTRNKTKEFEIEPDTRDVVTFMYYLRSQAFQVGEQNHYRVMSDEKLYDLYFDVKAAEPVKLEGYGRVPSLRIDPKAEFEGLFVRKGKMVLWVSTDARQICTQMKAEVPVASVRVMLAAVRGPGDDAWIKRAPEIKLPPEPPPKPPADQD